VQNGVPGDLPQARFVLGESDVTVGLRKR